MRQQICRADCRSKLVFDRRPTARAGILRYQVVHPMRAELLQAFLLGAAWCCAASAASVQQHSATPRPPVYDKLYEIAYNFSLPYEQMIQAGGLIYPVKVWRDGEGSRTRMDTWGGINSIITLKDEEVELNPRLDKMVCQVFEPDGLAQNALGGEVLPDISRWAFRGHAEAQGRQTYLWEYKQRHGVKETLYHFYATPSGEPVRLHMHGNNFDGSHFDEYLADFLPGSYKRRAPDASVFRRPELCKGLKAGPRRRASGFALQMAALLPTMRFSGGSAEYDHFAAAHSRRHSSQAEYERRMAVFQANKAYIDGWNAASNADDEDRHELAVNRFADWTQEEFEAVMLPKRGRERSLAGLSKKQHEIPYQALTDPDILPSTVSWQGTDGDGLVKDQAACGSCWAFGATAALEGAFWKQTGKQVAFSQQQLMDCSWGYGLNQACDGGDYDAAIEELVDGGGIMADADMPYRGQDAFCRVNQTSAERVQFKGYSYVPHGEDAVLREALFSRGPIAISLDAGQPSFRFYGRGVYREPNCVWKEDELDHAVTLMGYGRTQHGQDYWLVKNSWSTHWGNHGYIRIATNTGKDGRACGVTSDPLYAVYEGK